MFVFSNKKKTAVQQQQQQRLQQQQEENDQILNPDMFLQWIMKTIENRDYSAAATFIMFICEELNQPFTKEMALWYGYCLFHQGRYEDAITEYNKILEKDPDDAVLNLYISSCHYYNGDYDHAQKSAELGPNCDLKSRLFFHIASKRKDEGQLLEAHSQLLGTLENQLSLAAIHYMRSNFQDAINIYQKILLQRPEFLALHVYIAMCLFKLDQFDEANESVDQYLAVNSDSAISLNLKSCGYLRLFSPDVAEAQLLQISKFSSSSYDFIDALVQHNLVVFHNGEDGFTVLPKLVHSLSEAKYNLATLYMRENQPLEAYNVMQDWQPNEISESVLRASVLLGVGQINFDMSLIEESNSVFQEVGGMEVVRDTIPGRQCLATSKFIKGEYDETIRFLTSIENVDGMNECDEFNYDKAMALAAKSNFADAEKYFLLVKNEKYKREIFFVSWLARCFIRNGKPDKAWELYAESTQTEEAKLLLQIIATDCYQTNKYFYALKAFDTLSKCDLDPVYKEGMIASAIAVFRGVIARKEEPDKIYDVLTALANEPEAEETYKIISNFIETSNEFTMT